MARLTPSGLESRLRDANVTIVDDERSPVERLSYTRWQVAAMAAGANAHDGLSSPQLDHAFPVPSGAPPLSYFVAAGLEHADNARQR